MLTIPKLRLPCNQGPGRASFGGNPVTNQDYTKAKEAEGQEAA